MNSEKQARHILGDGYKPGRSYVLLSDGELQDVVNRYAGTGEIQRDRNGAWTHKELVQADRPVGYEVSLDGVETETDGDVYSYYGKSVTVHCTDGADVTGFFCIFTPAYDNDPEIAEVTWDIKGRLVGFPVPEIKSIEEVILSTNLETILLIIYQILENWVSAFFIPHQDVVGFQSKLPVGGATGCRQVSAPPRLGIHLPTPTPPPPSATASPARRRHLWKTWY